MSFIVVTVSDWHCCNIDYHKSNTLDRNKQYISKNKVWSGTIFWKPFAVVRRQFPFPDCFLFRTVRLQRPGISLWLIARPKMHWNLDAHKAWICHCIYRETYFKIIKVTDKFCVYKQRGILFAWIGIFLWNGALSGQLLSGVAICKTFE